MRKKKSPQNKGLTGPFKTQFTQMFQNPFLPRPEKEQFCKCSLKLICSHTNSDPQRCQVHSTSQSGPVESIHPLEIARWFSVKCCDELQVPSFKTDGVQHIAHSLCRCQKSSSVRNVIQQPMVVKVTEILKKANMLKQSFLSWLTLFR